MQLDGLIKQAAIDHPNLQKMLIFKVLESEGFPDAQNATFAVMVQNKVSELISFYQFQKEKFTIELSDEDDSFTFYVNPSPNLQTFMGKQDIPTYFLADKRVHTKKFSIALNNGGEARVTLHLQIVHSYVEYYETIKQEYQASIEEYEENIKAFKMFLDKLYRPFPTLRQDKAIIPGTDYVQANYKDKTLIAMSQKEVVDDYGNGWQRDLTLQPKKKPWEEGTHTAASKVTPSLYGTGANYRADREAVNLTPGAINMFSPAQSTQNNYQAISGYAPPYDQKQTRPAQMTTSKAASYDPLSSGSPPYNAPAELSSYVDTNNQKGHKHFHPFVHTLYYVMIGVFFIGMFISLWRPVFLAMMVSGIYICWYLMKDTHPLAFNTIIYGGLMVLAVILDVAWIWSSSTKLWRSKYIDNSSQRGIRSTAVFLSYMLLILEIVMNPVRQSTEEGGFFAEKYSSIWKALIEPKRNMFSMEMLGPKTRQTDHNSCFIREDGFASNSQGDRLSYTVYLHQKEQVFPPTRRCIIYLHSHGGNRMEGLSLLNYCPSMDASLCLFDFSGSGYSEGRYSSLGPKESHDVRTMIEEIKSRYKYTRFVLWGRSMGAVAALMYSSETPEGIEFQILDSPYSDLEQLVRDMGNSVIAMGEYLSSFIFSFVRGEIEQRLGFEISRLKPIEWCQRCTVPALFLVAAGDELVIPSRVKEMYDRYRGQKAFLFINGTHVTERTEIDLEKAWESIGNYFGIQVRRSRMQIQPMNVQPIPFNQELGQQQRISSTKKISLARPMISTQNITPTKESPSIKATKGIFDGTPPSPIMEPKKLQMQPFSTQPWNSLPFKNQVTPTEPGDFVANLNSKLKRIGIQPKITSLRTPNDYISSPRDRPNLNSTQQTTQSGLFPQPRASANYSSVATSINPRYNGLHQPKMRTGSVESQVYTPNFNPPQHNIYSQVTRDRAESNTSFGEAFQEQKIKAKIFEDRERSPNPSLRQMSLLDASYTSLGGEQRQVPLSRFDSLDKPRPPSSLDTNIYHVRAQPPVVRYPNLQAIPAGRNMFSSHVAYS